MEKGDGLQVACV